MLLTACMLLASVAGAQSPDGAEVIAQMLENQQEHRVFEVSFEHTVTQPDQAAKSRHGQAWFSRGRFRVAYDDIEYYDNDHFVFVHHRDVKRVFVHEESPDVYWDIDRLFLTDWGEAQIIELSSEMEAWRVTVKPPGDDLYRAELWIGREDHQLERAILFGSDGSRHAYVLNELQPTRRIPARVFTFNPRRYPDVEVLPMTDKYLTEEELEEY